MWGKVPYYFEDDVDYRKPNNMSSDSVVKLIIKDLDDATAILPSAPRSGQAGRATKFKAMAYKGRVQVNAGQYAAAGQPYRKSWTAPNSLWRRASIMSGPGSRNSPMAKRPSSRTTRRSTTASRTAITAIGASG